MSSFAKVGADLHESRYRPDIDGLRAIAVISVVLCHAFPRVLPGGFVGVDIFFVISGYLITAILLREAERGSLSLLHFYDRRIRRIFPALITTLLFVLMLGWFCLFSPEFAALGRHVTASSLFSENLLLWSEVGYFDRASEMKPTLHLWSLAIEEQFYILWPLLIYAAYRRRWNRLPIFIGLAGLSFAVNLYDIQRGSGAAAFYSPLGRSWELITGACLAYGQLRNPALLSRFADWQSALGLVLIIAALLLIRPGSSFPGFWALLPTVGALLLLSSGERALANRYLLAAPPMVWCGLISYPLYLWHWPLLSFGHIIRGGLVAVSEGWACVIVSSVAATVTFVFVERPFRLRGGRFSSAGYLITGMAVMLACGLLMSRQVLLPRLFGFDAPARTEWDFLRKGMKSLDNDTVGIYRLGANRKKLALFIGDSHIAEYAERLDRLITADPERLGAVLAIGGGCIPVEGVSFDNPERAGCERQTRQAYRMAEAAEFDTVLIGGDWNWYLLGPGYALAGAGLPVPLSTPAGKQRVLDYLATRIRALQAGGKRVIFLLDNPQSGALGATGRAVRLSLSARNFQPQTLVAVDPRQAALHDELLAWATALRVTVIDPFGAVCAGNLCRVTSDSGQPLYKDFGHFNPDWAIDHATFIDTAVDPRHGRAP